MQKSRLWITSNAPARSWWWQWRYNCRRSQVVRSFGSFEPLSPVTRLCNEGKIDEALTAVSGMVQQGIYVPSSTFYCLLRGCMDRRDLSTVRYLHSQIIKSGHESDSYLGNHLIRLYTLCGSLADARKVFGNLCAPDRFAWGAIISAHSKHGQVLQAISLYHDMRKSGVKPGDSTFVSVLKACGSLAALVEGKLIHADVATFGSESNQIVGSALINMYANCGSLVEAQGVFDRLELRDRVAWTAMISGYVKHGLAEKALVLYEQMLSLGIQPDAVTLSSVLKACSSLQALDFGRLIHVHIGLSGVNSDLFVVSTLITMYCNCASPHNARTVFDSLRDRDQFAWSAMIAGYVQNGCGVDALGLCYQMQLEGLQPDKVSFVSILQACASTGALEQGQLVHAQILNRGFEVDLFIESSLIDMYVKCGSLDNALIVFDSLSQKDVVTWNAMIAGFVHYREGQLAFQLFNRMQRQGICPDKITLVNLLKACSCIGSLELGKLVHARIVETGYENEVFVGNTLIEMYATCGGLYYARGVFDNMCKRDVVSWNSMIAGYVEHEDTEEALQLFLSLEEDGVRFNKVTLGSILRACSGAGAMEQGEVLHAYIMQHGLDSDTVIASALLDMYAKCGSLKDAEKLFARLQVKDVVSWNAMIAGFADQGDGHSSLMLYKEMQVHGMLPNRATFVSALKACTLVGSLGEGKQIHAAVMEGGLNSESAVGSILIDMYAKCGDIKTAREVFDAMITKDLTSWNAMIAGYAHAGSSDMALKLFQQMQLKGQHPDKVTFVSLLAACSHAGLLEEGKKIFRSMTADFGLFPAKEHYACMIDLLGRTGHLVEAEAIIEEMPVEPDSFVWTSILGACQIYGNLEIARRSFNNILKIDHRDASAYVLMSNAYSAMGKWEEAKTVRIQMEAAGARKQAGRSWIEVGNSVHAFAVKGNNGHPDGKQMTVETLLQSIDRLKGFRV